jgi:hypothetical protein
MSAIVGRPRFDDRHVVSAGSLEAEQAYLVAMRRLHDRDAHSWGIVSGLTLARDPAGMVIDPGMAIDGFGRSLVLSEPVTVPVASLATVGRAADVWLLYGRLPSTPPQRGRWDCSPEQNTRWSEKPCVRLSAPSTPTSPRQPPGVPPTLLEPDPASVAPDAPRPVWPVYLGQVQLDDSGAVQTVDGGGRPGVGLVGERIDHPARVAAVRVGGEPGGFALATPEADGTLAERFTISSAGQVAARGRTTVNDALHLAGTQTGASRVTLGQVAPPAAAAWSLYRTTIKSEPGGRTVRQLRIEIGHPGEKGDPARYRLVVGQAGEDGQFAPLLSVSSNRVVKVFGPVTVRGLIVQGAVPANESNPRFAAAAVAARLLGIRAASMPTGGLS